MKIPSPLFCVLGIFLWTACNPESAANSTLTVVSQGETPVVSPTPSLAAAPTLSPTITVQPSATSTITPTPTRIMPSLGGAITSETAGQLTLLKTWGKGNFRRIEWIKGGSLLIIQTDVGVYAYGPDDWLEKAAWEGVRELVISKKGSTLAMGLSRGKAILWNFETNVQLEINQGYDPEIARKWIKPVYFWESVQDEIDGKRVFPDPLALSDDGQILAIAGRDSQTGIWNTEDGSRTGTLLTKVGTPPIHAAFSPGADRLVTSDARGNLVVWDIEKKSVLTKEITAAGSFSDSPFSPDGSLLATFSGNDIYVWDSTSGSRRSRFWTSLEWIHDVFFSDDGKYIIVNDHEWIIRVSDGQTVPSETLPSPEEKPYPDISALASEGFMIGTITGVALDRDGFPLAWGVEGWIGSQWFWRIAEKRFEPPDWSHCENIRTGYSFPSVTYMPSGMETRLVAISPDCALQAEVKGKSIHVSRTSDQTLLHGLSAHTQGISVLVFSPGGKYFASGSSPSLYSAANELVLWRADPAIGLWKINSGVQSVTAIGFTDDETMVAVASDRIRLWRTADHLLMDSLNRSATAITFSPDGKILAIADWTASITLFSVQDFTELVVLQGPQGNYLSITSLAFTPDGAGLLAGISDGTVRLWGIPEVTD